MHLLLITNGHLLWFQKMGCDVDLYLLSSNDFLRLQSPWLKSPPTCILKRPLDQNQHIQRPILADTSVMLVYYKPSIKGFETHGQSHRDRGEGRNIYRTALDVPRREQEKVNQ